MNRTMIMPCGISGIFGAVFAMACGVVDGAGSKDAIADNSSSAEEMEDTGSFSTGQSNMTEPVLSKKVYAGDCSNPEFVFNEGWNNYTAWEYFDSPIPPTAMYTAWFYSYENWSTQHIDSVGIQCGVVSDPADYVPYYDAWKVVIIQ